MKRICVIVCVAIAVLLQSCSIFSRADARAPKEPNMAVQQDSLPKKAEQQQPKITAKPSKKEQKPKAVNKKKDDAKKDNVKKNNEVNNQSPKVANDAVSPNWFQRQWQKVWKKSGDNDCKKCQNDLATANKKTKSLEQKVKDLEKKLGSTKDVMAIDNWEFYRSLILAPLTKKYDPGQVDCYKKTIALFDHEKNAKMKWVYDGYYPLLENYGQYNQDIATLIVNVIKAFERLGVPERNTYGEMFEEGFKSTEYYRKYRKKINNSQEIEYLEDVVSETMSLFKDPSTFKKENFEAQLRRLGVERK